MPKARKPAEPARPGKPKKSVSDLAAEEAFRRAAVARGDAVRSKNGKLPPGATFEIERLDETGTPVIKRKRFSVG
jgi:hypothetical protein